MSRFLYQQIALDVLFQMRYDSLPNSKKQLNDSLKSWITPSFPQIRIVLLTALHSDVLLGSAGIPLHFGLSLCNPFEQIRLPYMR